MWFQFLFTGDSKITQVMGYPAAKQDESKWQKQTVTINDLMDVGKN